MHISMQHFSFAASVFKQWNQFIHSAFGLIIKLHLGANQFIHSAVWNSLWSDRKTPPGRTQRTKVHRYRCRTCGLQLCQTQSWKQSLWNRTFQTWHLHHTGGKKRSTFVFLFKASTQKCVFYCMPGWLFKTGGILRPRWGSWGQIVFMTH